MRLGDVDTIATLGRTPLNRISAPTKLVAFGFILVAVLVTTNAFVMLSVALALAAAVVALGLPLRLVFGLSAYAAVFAGVFVIAAAPGWIGAILVISKATSAALAALTLTLTTPYPDLFAPMQRVLPVVIGDALLMTYRSFFLLLDRMDSTLTAARLRAGRPTGAASGIRLAGAALGGVLLYSLDLSQRTYDVMRIRGYTGRLVVSRQAPGPFAFRSVTLAFSLAILLVSIAWRAWWSALNPWSWIPLVVAALMLVASLALRPIALRRQS